MKRTFFEHLGIADIERIHSQVLKWILSKDNEALSREQQNEFVTDFFGIKDFQISSVITEYENIDIVIKSQSDIICIENKLKSSQHSNQLDRYEKIIKKKYENRSFSFFFLTLIEEKSSNENWRNISYQQLLDSLGKLKTKDNLDGLILGEYIKTLHNFSKIIENFLQKPSGFMNVFLDGNKTKHEKILENKNPEERFISDNQLETILQKLYLKKVAEKTNQKNYGIFERNGNAILQIVLETNIDFNGTPFCFTLDYQNGTFKTLCIIEGEESYNESEPDDIPEVVKEKFQKIIDKKLYGYQRVNKAKSKATYSITKRNKELIGVDVESFVQKINEEIKLSKDIIRSVTLDNVC